METTEKILLMRKSEQLTQDYFCSETGLKLSTLKRYEQGRTATIPSDQLLKITKHERFKKYALWLVTDTIAPEAGQISPEIETIRRKINLPDTLEGYRIANESLSAGAHVRDNISA